MTKEEWIDYFCLVCDHVPQEEKMPVMRGGDSVIYDPFYDIHGVANMATSEVCKDPFWGAFDHAIKMLEFFKLLPDKERDYWFEFVDAQEYPSEEELDTFVNKCKECMKSEKKNNPSILRTTDRAFAGLTDSIENIEGFWPYA